MWPAMSSPSSSSAPHGVASTQHLVNTCEKQILASLGMTNASGALVPYPAHQSPPERWRLAAGHEIQRIVARPTRQCQDEPGAAIRPTVECEITLHPTRQISTDRQSEPKAFLRLRERSIKLDERLEHLFVTSLRHPRPGIGNAHRHP